MARRRNATEPVTTYVTPADLERIDEAADEKGLTRAAFVRSTLIAELVERSRREQGLPSRIEDAATIRRVADILLAGEKAS